MQQGSSGLRGTTLWTPLDDERSGVLIMGVRRGDIFVATQVLISTDTLGGEKAIRAWLAQHNIHVSSRSSRTASMQKILTEPTGS